MPLELEEKEKERMDNEKLTDRLARAVENFVRHLRELGLLQNGRR